MAGASVSDLLLLIDVGNDLEWLSMWKTYKCWSWGLKVWPAKQYMKLDFTIFSHFPQTSHLTFVRQMLSLWSFVCSCSDTSILTTVFIIFPRRSRVFRVSAVRINSLTLLPEGHRLDRGVLALGPGYWPSGMEHYNMRNRGSCNKRKRDKV